MTRSPQVEANWSPDSKHSLVAPEPACSPPSGEESPWTLWVAELHSASPALRDRDFAHTCLPLPAECLVPLSLAVLLPTLQVLQAFLTSELALGSFCTHLLQKSCLFRPFVLLAAATLTARKLQPSAAVSPSSDFCLLVTLKHFIK